ncbi:FecR domain-containing protein [Tenacibaculum pacificus]|uniref:FecR family protein n=1 Tax=Tenacibaculum pacificus TaxID=3018314 RepID=UPI0022F3C281|nr:FecR domain-containing protein [Tenacibaculum pacificus]WBX74597.1 FecR domain-containing protein [Tenacibaculum pacificus]
MINKLYNNIDDFLKDTSFKNWALNSKLSDVSFWQYWLINNPDKKEIAEEAKAIIIGIQFKENLISKEKVNFAWNDFEAKILEREQKIKKNTFNKNRWLAIAVSVILFISIGIYTFVQNNITSYTSGFGEILHIKLQDGSLVTLNSNSTISYSKETPREVTLNGEAYFEVAKKETTNAKFWVFTNDLKVEVYGTKFNVKSNTDKTQVFLEEGNIWLALKNGTAKKMIPGDLVSFSVNEDKILENRSKVLATENTSWKTGILTFNNATLSKVFKKVSEAYGYEVVFKNTDLKNILISGAIPTSNLEICLKAIEKSVNVIITKENTKLVVSKK